MAAAPTPAPSFGGWLIASGVRGAGPRCTVTFAYDVATGAAFRREACADRARDAAGRVPPAMVADAVARLTSAQPSARSAERQAMAAAPMDIAWVLARDDGRVLVGSFERPSDRGRDDDAARAFDALERTFAGDCAPLAPPPYTRLVAEVPVMATPVSADAAQALFQAYRTARERWLALGTCAAPKRR